MDLSDTNRFDIQVRSKELETAYQMIADEKRLNKKSKLNKDFFPITRNHDLSKRDALSLSPKKNLECILPPLKEKNKKTLLLDLDETLVHSSFDHFDSPDVKIDIEIDGTKYTINVLVRPDTEFFLVELSKYFEIITYTASLSKYADPLITKLDPFGKISYRLFREHCTYMDGIYIKDLSKLGRELRNLIIIDNSPESYKLQPYNGIPIKSWYNEKNDFELKKLIPILINLVNFHDVRAEIGKIVYDDLIDWDKLGKWLTKIKKKKQLETYKRNIEKFNTSLIENLDNPNVIDLDKTNDIIINKNNNKLGVKESNIIISKVKGKTIKDRKKNESFFNVQSKKINSKSYTKLKKSINKSSINTFSNLETTMNNNTLNSTVQNNLTIDHLITCNGDDTIIQNQSKPISTMVNINYKMNKFLSNYNNQTFKSKSSKMMNRNIFNKEGSLNKIAVDPQINDLKSRNLVYTQQIDKPKQMITPPYKAHVSQKVENKSKEKIETNHISSNKCFHFILTSKNKANPINKTNNNPKTKSLKLEQSKIASCNLSKSTLNSITKIQNKLSRNSIELKKKNTIPRNFKVQSSKEVELNINNICEKNKINNSLHKSNEILIKNKEVNDKMIVYNTTKTELISVYSRNNRVNNNLILNSLSTSKNKFFESNYNIKSKKNISTTSNGIHKKNISFKF